MISENLSPILSIIVPVYNSSAIIEKLLHEISFHISKINISYEVIIIDDGSIDNTLDSVIEWSAYYSNVYYTGFKSNQGQHKATYYGLLASKGRYCITLDDDLTFSPNEITKLLIKQKKMNADIIYGIAETKSNSLPKIVSRYSKLLFKQFTILNGKGSSFRLINKHALLAHFDGWPSNFFFLDLMLHKITKRIYFVNVASYSSYLKYSRYTLYSKIKIFTQVILYKRNSKHGSSFPAIKSSNLNDRFKKLY